MSRLRDATTAIVLGVAVAACVPGSASAQTFDVKPLEVKKGELELSSENSLHVHVPHALGSDINRMSNDHGLHYGVTDWWKIAGIFKFEKPEQDEYRFSKVAMENVIILKALDEKAQRDLGLGWFTSIEASVHRDTTNAVQYGPIVTLKADKLSFTANPFFEKTFGRNHIEGTAFVYGLQAKYDIREGFALGIEAFGVIENLGNTPPWEEQEHRIGPVLFTEFELAKDVKIAPDFGVLFGLTKATPDVAFKLNVGIPLYKQANGRNGG
ncbi:MAG: hypothetical protein ACKVP7_19830 [Hyphomicrobiaceae bacterium]